MKGNRLMIIKTMKNIKRAPVRAVAVLLFAAVITMIICAMQASNEAELRSYEEAYQAIPVTVTVTEPSGVNTDSFFIRNWVLDIFTGTNPVQILDLSEAENDDEALYQGLKSLVETPSNLAHYQEKAAKRGRMFSTENTVKAVEEMFELL